MSRFIEWLEELNGKDSKVRAVLRRGLSFDPGAFPPTYPYVEPFMKGEDNSWRRDVHYLVAGLWAMHWRAGRIGAAVSVGAACAIHKDASKSESTEKRFIALLDSDRDQLPNRLRQMVALLKEQNLDFEGILRGLLFWSDEKKRTQNAWARDFYRSHASKIDENTDNNISVEEKIG